MKKVLIFFSFGKTLTHTSWKSLVYFFYLKLIDRKYFDVLKGTYQLVVLKNGKYQLNLWSEFQVNTTFNFYAGIWAKWITKDIQNNILQVIKQRCEQSLVTEQNENLLDR